MTRRAGGRIPGAIDRAAAMGGLVAAVTHSGLQAATARSAALEAAWVRLMHLTATIATGQPWVDSVIDEVRRRQGLLDELAAIESVGDDLARGRLTP